MVVEGAASGHSLEGSTDAEGAIQQLIGTVEGGVPFHVVRAAGGWTDETTGATHTEADVFGLLHLNGYLFPADLDPLLDGDLEWRSLGSGLVAGEPAAGFRVDSLPGAVAGWPFGPARAVEMWMADGLDPHMGTSADLLSLVVEWETETAQGAVRSEWTVIESRVDSP